MNHHAQRLLVAASRGARIQYIPSFGPKTWMETRNISILFADECRIHPDDIACQYGPIATELRKKANVYAPHNPDPLFSKMADWWLNYFDELVFYLCSEEYSWACLFAAELAADEGM